MKDDPPIKAKAKIEINEWKVNYVKCGYHTLNTSLPHDRIKLDWTGATLVSPVTLQLLMF